jgi:WD40 repeat protein
LLPLERTTLAQVGQPVPAGHSVTELLTDRTTGDVLVLREDKTVRRVDPSDPRGPQPPAMGPLTTDRVVPALSPDGRHLMGLDTDRRVRLMNLTTGTWLPPATRADWASDFTFVYSPDGTQVASSGPDRIRLWDGRTGQYQASMPLPEGAPDVSIAFLPDSDGLLVTTVEGSSWTIPTRTSAWSDRACAIAGRNLTQAEWDQHFPGRAYRAQCPQ